MRDRLWYVVFKAHFNKHYHAEAARKGAVAERTVAGFVALTGAAGFVNSVWFRQYPNALTFFIGLTAVVSVFAAILDPKSKVATAVSARASWAAISKQSAGLWSQHFRSETEGFLDLQMIDELLEDVESAEQTTASWMEFDGIKERAQAAATKELAAIFPSTAQPTGNGRHSYPPTDVVPTQAQVALTIAEGSS